MPIFIIDNNPGFKKPICLSKDDEHHLVRVMRAIVGEEIHVTDNAGLIGVVKITSISPFVLSLKSTAAGPKPLTINIALPLIEQERLEWAIEKLTELNVAEIFFTITERTQRSNLPDAKLMRLHKIVISAQKQCGRCWPLRIFLPMKLKAVMALQNKTRFFVADIGTSTQQTNTLHKIQRAKSQEQKTIFIGPEGGFTADERALFVKYNAEFCNLGETILRTETAAIVATVILNLPAGRQAQ